MMTIRKSQDRGVGRHGWLVTRHTFSFANYYDPAHMGFRSLRVINEDTVAPGKGFGAHRHDNMEIVSIVMEGALAHKDSTGGEGVLRRGEVQRMSAGTGVVHSEFNASSSEPVHFFQIWILPDVDGIAPEYEQKPLPDEPGKLCLLPLNIHQDAKIYFAMLDDGTRVEHILGAGRGAWLQVARGSVDVYGSALQAGDGAAIEGETSLAIAAGAPAEILLFDLG